MGAFPLPFTFSKFLLSFTARENLYLPAYKGSTFRGGFGQAFRRTVCVARDKECDECLLRLTCVYSYVFNTPAELAEGMVPNNTQAPHPFVIEPEADARTTYKPGETFSLGLVLIGRAIDYLPYFIYTFDKMAEHGLGRGRGKCLLQSVSCLGANGKQWIVYDGEQKVLTSDCARLDFESFIEAAKNRDSVCSIDLDFTTPTRIRYQEKLTDKLPFHVLMRNLLRRISTLDNFHCGGSLQFDHKALIAKAETVQTTNSTLHWHDWERYSSRQDTRMKLGGLLGSVTYKGELNEFLPYLLLGEQIHVGKGTSFGLGRYKILGDYR